MKQFKLPEFSDDIKGTNKEKNMTVLCLSAYVHDLLIPATEELQTFTSYNPVCSCCGVPLFMFNPKTNDLDHDGEIDHINPTAEQKKMYVDSPMYNVKQDRITNHTRRKGSKCCYLCNIDKVRFKFPIQTPALTPVSKWSWELIRFWVDNIDKPYIRNYIKLHFRPTCSQCNWVVSRKGYCLKRTAVNNVTHNTTSEHKGIVKSSLELDSIYRTNGYEKPTRETTTVERREANRQKSIKNRANRRKTDPEFIERERQQMEKDRKWYTDYCGTSRQTVLRASRHLENEADIPYEEAREKIVNMFHKFHLDPNLVWKNMCAGGKGSGKSGNVGGWVDKRTDLIVWSKNKERIGKRASSRYKIFKETGEPFWK